MLNPGDDVAIFIAGRIAEAIRESEYTLYDISKKMGVSRTAVYKWQQLGHITLPHLFMLASIVKRPMAWFLLNDDSQALDPSLIQAHIKLLQNI